MSHPQSPLLTCDLILVHLQDQCSALFSLVLHCPYKGQVYSAWAVAVPTTLEVSQGTPGINQKGGIPGFWIPKPADAYEVQVRPKTVDEEGLKEVLADLSQDGS